MSRVLLVYHNPLFAYSIRTALRGAPRIHLVGELKDWTRVKAEITRLEPDVVLVEEDESAAMDEMLGVLRVRQSPWRVVAMRLDETTMHVWSGAGKELQDPQDLYSALRSDPGRHPRYFRAARRITPPHGGQ